jgi:ribosomal RNA-processing protein 17
LEKHVNEVNSLLRKARSPSPSSSSEKEEFTGFDSPQPQPQPLPEAIDREDEYIDEDKYTTVTIESVGIGKEGFEKVDDEKEDAEEKKEEEGRWPKEKTKIVRPKKIKKPKFRYESKAERKTTRMKQGAKNRAAAQARKGT